MKKSFIITFVVLITNFVQAQNYHPFPTSNASWSEFYQGNSSSYSYTNIIQSEDTIIGTITYHKLYRYQLGYDTTYIGAIGEDSSKQVFFYDNVSGYNFLLYDFSLNTNDTMSYPDTSTEYYGYNKYNYGIVDSIDSVLIGDDYRKEYYINGDIWFEGIGSINGLLYPIMPHPTCYCDWDLICFQQGDSILYCPKNTDNVINYKIDNSDVLTIYPNPAENFILIKSALTGEKDIRLINSLGNSVCREFNSMNEIQLDLKDINPGIYYLIVRTKDNVTTRKIIIN